MRILLADIISISLGCSGMHAAEMQRKRLKILSDWKQTSLWRLKIRALKNHILLKGYNANDAIGKACKVMHLASCVLSGKEYQKIDKTEEYLSARIEGNEYKNFVYVRKMDIGAYAYLVEASRNLNV